MATSWLRDLCVDCHDPHLLARFWSEVLGYTIRPTPPGSTDIAIEPEPLAGGMRIWFNQVPEPKVVKNRVHIDINMPDHLEMDRLQRLGAHALQEIRDAEGKLKWTIMVDPEGNEFCAFLPPGS
jgi:predicted enzyme related to lactoylglutathione lyase